MEAVRTLSTGPGEYNAQHQAGHGRITCKRSGSTQSVDWQYRGEGD